MAPAARPSPDAVVVVEGTRIKAVGTRGQVPVPAGANVIRLNGRTILPGLIDTHVHLREWHIPMFLAYGVTTIADIHNDTKWTVAQREALKSGKMQGPRLFVSGARVTGLQGAVVRDPSYVRDVAQARAYVRYLKEVGADQVKVGRTITRAAEGGPRRSQDCRVACVRAHEQHQGRRGHGHEAHWSTWTRWRGRCSRRKGRIRSRRGRRLRPRSIRLSFRR